MCVLSLEARVGRYRDGENFYRGWLCETMRGSGDTGLRMPFARSESPPTNLNDTKHTRLPLLKPLAPFWPSQQPDVHVL